MKVKIDITAEEYNALEYSLHSSLATALGYVEMYKDSNADNGFWKLEADRIKSTIKAIEKWEVII